MRTTLNKDYNVTIYTVLDNNRDTLGKFTSLATAVKAIENSFQCGIEETLKEVRASLKATTFTVVSHAICSNITCIIETQPTK